jgi:hypothetical protein
MNVSSLALMGDVSGPNPVRKSRTPIRDIFDEETRRKPLAFAAGAGHSPGYGI